MHKQNSKKSDKAGVIIFPPLLFIVVLAIGIITGYIFPTLLLPKNVAVFSGGFLLILSLVLLQTAVRTLLKYKTAVNPNRATTTIVKKGVYQYTRNPMYVSFTLIYISISVMTNSWYGLLFLIPLPLRLKREL